MQAPEQPDLALFTQSTRLALRYAVHRAAARPIGIRPPTSGGIRLVAPGVPRCARYSGGTPSPGGHGSCIQGGPKVTCVAHERSMFTPLGPRRRAC
jgi:hypothetical protein